MLTPSQLAALREEYSQRGLRRSDLHPNPIVQFNAWLADAAARQIPEPNAMTLATVDAAGRPWSRTVLLKICDEDGFAFFTNYTSAKGRHLERDPRAALTFWWGALERQVNVTGAVSRVSREETDAYFQSRPRASQLGAWASAQSEVIAGRAQLDAKFSAAEKEFGDAEIPAPPHWGGYRLAPETVEFWQGRRSRLHDRFRYRRIDDVWIIERLSP